MSASAVSYGVHTHLSLLLVTDIITDIVTIIITITIIITVTIFTILHWHYFYACCCYHCIQLIFIINLKSVCIWLCFIKKKENCFIKKKKTDL